MVAGFSTGPLDLRGEPRVYPHELTAYRKFRFMPRPVYQSYLGINQEWATFASAGEPTDFSVLQCATGDFLRRQVASVRNGGYDPLMYYGSSQWQPCLTATTYGHVAYTSGENTAFCAGDLTADKAQHPAPHPDCSCGYWAYYTADKIDTGTSDQWTSTAAVQVWGDIVPGTKGVRAQKMRIVGVVPPVEIHHPISTTIAQAWQQLVADLCIPQYSSLAQLLAAHPPQDVSGLIPKAEDGYVRTVYNGPNYQVLTTGANGANVTSFAPTYLSSSSWVSPNYNLWAPMFTTACSICSYTLTAQTQKDLDRFVADHYSTVHLMPVSATADAA